MNKLLIAFDVDGTLRCNCETTCRNANAPMAEIARWLKQYTKNCTLIAWSGGGKPYVESVVRDMGLDDVFPPKRCFGKLDPVKPDIAFDDMHEFILGDKNIIVKMK